MRNAVMIFGLSLALGLPAAELPQPVDRTGHWSLLDAKDAGLADGSWQPLDQALDSEDYPGISSVLVAHDGYLIYERYREGDAEELRDTRSATKTVTAMLVGIAMAQELLGKPDDPVMPLFDDHRRLLHPDPRKDATSFKDLLTMSSLLDCNDDNPYSRGNEERMYVREDWTGFVLDLPIKGFAPWMTRPEDSPYGRSFSYCTAGAYLLGAAIERASGKSLAAFAAAYLERPLGIQSVRWNQSPLGVGIGGGGTRYRSRDLLKLGELLRLQGRWGDHQILPSHWARAMLTVQLEAREDAQYGYLIWRFDYPQKGRSHPVWAMSGNGGNYVFIDPATNSVAVVTSSAYNQRYAHPNSQRIYAEKVLPELVKRTGPRAQGPDPR